MSECSSPGGQPAREFSSWLESFFRQWPENLKIQPVLPNRDTGEFDLPALSDLLNRLSDPACAFNLNALAFDPWDVAGLARKEVPNAAVLAWLLNPAGSHGFDRRALCALLRLLPAHGKVPFPTDYQHYCRVVVESAPTGDRQNRVDIEIDADSFYLLIEVKIDAGEQAEQLLRYRLEAESRAGSRPWAVLFLTPQGRRPVSITDDCPSLYPSLSWSALASQFSQALKTDLQQAAASGTSAQQAAGWAIRRYLQRMRQF